jgi:hypothetical protein
MKDEDTRERKKEKGEGKKERLMACKSILSFDFLLLPS